MAFNVQGFLSKLNIKSSGNSFNTGTDDEEEKYSWIRQYLNDIEQRQKQSEQKYAAEEQEQENLRNQTYNEYQGKLAAERAQGLETFSKGRGIDWGTGQAPIDVSGAGKAAGKVSAGKDIKSPSTLEKLNVAGMNLFKGKPITIEKSLRVKGYFIDKLREYPEEVDVVGQTGDWYFYRYTDPATGKSDIESVKKSDLTLKLTPEQKAKFLEGKLKESEALRKQQESIMKDWNKKSLPAKLWEKTSATAASTIFGTAPTMEAGISPAGQTTGNLITDIATGVLGTVMGMATPVGGSSLLGLGNEIGPAAVRGVTGRAVSKTLPGAIVRSGAEVAGMNMPISAWSAGIEQESPENMAKQVAIDTLAAFGLGAGFKAAGEGIKAGISKYRSVNDLIPVIDQATGNVMKRTKVSGEVTVKKTAAPKSYTVKNQRLSEAILGKAPSNVQASIKVPSLLETKMLKEGTLRKPVKRSDIEKFISDTLEVPVGKGKFKYNAGGGFTRMGIFKVQPEVIRLKNTKDLDTLYHETGHFLDKYFKLRDTKFKSELEPLAQKVIMPNYTEDQVLGEGVAEFMKHYLIDPAGAKTAAPKFYNYFETAIKSNSDIVKMMKAVRIATENFTKQDPFAYVLSNLSIGEHVKEKKSFYSNFVDQDIAAKKAAEKIAGKDYANLSVKNNPYEQLILKRGIKGKATAMIENGIRDDKDVNLKRITRGFEEIMKPFKGKKNEENLRKFKAYVTSLRGLEAMKKNIKTGLGNKTKLEAVVAEGKRLGFDRIEAELQDFQKKLLQNTLVRSGIVSKQTAATWDALWEHYVPFNRVMDTMAQRGTGAKVQAYDPIHGMKGSTRDIIDPVESIIKNVYLFNELAARNDVNTAFARLYETYHGAGKVLDKIPTPLKATQFNLKEIKGALVAEGIPEYMLEGLSSDSLATIFRPRIPGLSDNTITAFRNGKPQYYEVFDKDLYKLMQGMDKESANFLINICSVPAKILRAGATGTLDFAVKNPFRDAWTAYVYSKYGFLPIFDTLKGVSHALKKSDVYYKWMYSGGGNSELAAIDRLYLQGNVREIMKSKTQKAAGLLNPLTAMQKISMVSEQATRLAEFMKGSAKEMKRGRTPGEAYSKAALASRDITLDFARVGSSVKQANRIIAFLNASIQGTDKMVRAFKEHPVKSAYRTAGAITSVSVGLYFINRNNPYYNERPTWEKDLYWHIPIYPDGSAFLKLPKPFELGVLFGTVPERMLRKFEADDPTAFDGILPTFADAFFPDFIPTGLKPIIESMTNYSFFQGRNIVPQSEQFVEPAEQYNDYTSEMAKFFGKMLNYSPRKIDNLIQGYTGGLGKYFTNAIDLMAGKEMNPLKTAPIIKSFVSEGVGSESQSVQELYKLTDKEEIKYKSDVKKGVAEKGEPPTYLSHLRKVKKSFSEKRNEITALRNDDKLDREQKKKQIQQIQRDMIDIARSELGKTPLK